MNFTHFSCRLASQPPSPAGPSPGMDRVGWCLWPSARGSSFPTHLSFPPHLIFQRLLCSCNRRVFPRGYPLAKTQGQRAIRQGTCARRWPPRSNPYTRDIQVRASQTVAPRAPGCLVKYRPLGPQIHYIASPTARPGAGNLMRWPDDTHEH